MEKNNAGGISQVKVMLQAIRADLESNQIDLHGIHDDVLDMIYQYYTELVSTESYEARQAHFACMDAILKIIRERDEARGMRFLQEPDCEQPQIIRKQDDQNQENPEPRDPEWDGDYSNLPYNQEVEDLLGLFSEDASALEKSTFKVGFAAGARLVFELLGEGPVGVRNRE